jgi:hypothetical protein
MSDIAEASETLLNEISAIRNEDSKSMVSRARNWMVLLAVTELK